MGSLKEKNKQLGMNAGTAQSRLIKDILWSLIVQTGQDKCHVCGEEMSRETYTIEHIKPWLYEPNAKELFWDLDNISFSHAKCNRPRKKEPKEVPHGTINSYIHYSCRCEECKQAYTIYRKSTYSKEKRHKTYLKTGK